MAFAKRIVVATDFSRDADRAAQVAVAWAEQMGAELHWVHGLEHLPRSTPPSATPLIASYVEQAHHACQEGLAAAEATARARGIACECHVVDAPPARSVVERVRKLSADCVIVGSRGHGGLQHLLLGSVAERIARDAPCRVLVVREGGAADRPGTIVLGDDLTDLSARARADAWALADLLAARVEVVHAPELGIPWFSSVSFAMPEGVFEDIRREASEQLDAVLAEAPDGIEIDRVIARDEPARAICERAKQTGAGLVVVGTRSPSDIERVLLGSVADRVVRHAPCSVLVVR